MFWSLALTNKTSNVRQKVPKMDLPDPTWQQTPFLPMLRGFLTTKNVEHKQSEGFWVAVVPLQAAAALQTQPRLSAADPPPAANPRGKNQARIVLAAGSCSCLIDAFPKPPKRWAPPHRSSMAVKGGSRSWLALSETARN